MHASTTPLGSLAGAVLREASCLSEFLDDPITQASGGGADGLRIEARDGSLIEQATSQIWRRATAAP